MALVTDILSGQVQLKADFESFVAKVGTTTAALQAQITALQAQIAAGGGIKATDLDPVLANVTALDAEIKAQP